VGQFKDDQAQGHYHILRTYYDTNWGFQNSNTAAKGDIQNSGLADNNTVNLDSRVTSPKTDGTNGTPRTGTTTRGKRLGVNYIIKT
jgi:hypothetical protein